MGVGSGRGREIFGSWYIGGIWGVKEAGLHRMFLFLECGGNFEAGASVIPRN